VQLLKPLFPILIILCKSNSFILEQFSNPPLDIDVRLYKVNISIEIQFKNAFDLIVFNFGKLSTRRDLQP
jgi:hypothetical protein